MTTYTVQSGDTLGKIAKQFLGNAALYPKIAEANNIADPNKISVGQQLVIPERPATPEQTFSLTAQQFKDILQTDDNELVEKYLDGLNQCFADFEINTPLRACHFLAQVSHESGGFKRVTENLNYGAPGLRATFPSHFQDDEVAQQYARQPEQIANRAYASRMGNGDEASGDGWAYRGRGLIQMTGKQNYQDYSKTCDVDVVANPDLISEDPAHCVGAAGWFWDSHALNQYADQDDIKTITRKINGGLNGLENRTQRLEQAKSVLGV